MEKEIQEISKLGIEISDDQEELLSLTTNPLTFALEREYEIGAKKGIIIKPKNIEELEKALKIIENPYPISQGSKHLFIKDEELNIVDLRKIKVMNVENNIAKISGSITFNELFKVGIPPLISLNPYGSFLGFTSSSFSIALGNYESGSFNNVASRICRKVTQIKNLIMECQINLKSFRELRAIVVPANQISYERIIKEKPVLWHAELVNEGISRNLGLTGFNWVLIYPTYREKLIENFLRGVKAETDLTIYNLNSLLEFANKFNPFGMLFSLSGEGREYIPIVETARNLVDLNRSIEKVSEYYSIQIVNDVRGETGVIRVSLISDLSKILEIKDNSRTYLGFTRLDDELKKELKKRRRKNKINVNGEIAKCIQCGACNSHCPVERITGLSKYSPKGKIALSELNVGDSWFYCTNCGNCLSSCPVAINFRGLHEKALRENKVRPSGLMNDTRILIKKDEMYNVPSSIVKDAVGLIPKVFEESEEGEVGLYLGCIPFLNINELSILGEIFNRLGIKVKVIPHYSCCGYPYLKSALKQDYEKAIKLTKEKLGKFKKVIFLCPEAYYTFRRIEKADFQPIFWTQLLKDVRLSQSDYSLHIGCHLMGFEEEEGIRNLGSNFKDINRSCSGGPVGGFSNEVSEKICKSVTLCPFSLSRNQENSTISLIDFIAMSLGIDLSKLEVKLPNEVKIIVREIVEDSLNENLNYIIEMVNWLFYGQEVERVSTTAISPIEGSLSRKFEESRNDLEDMIRKEIAININKPMVRFRYLIELYKMVNEVMTSMRGDFVNKFRENFVGKNEREWQLIETYLDSLWIKLLEKTQYSMRKLIDSLLRGQT